MRRWFKKQEVPFSDLKEHPCLNCNHIFKGYYCPNCGQSVKEFDRPFGFVFYDFLGNIVAFDSRLFKTITSLVAHPGKLTLAFFRGKRASYAPPFRSFIFLSFILFLLLQTTTNRSLTTILDKSYGNEMMQVDPITPEDFDSLSIKVGALTEKDRNKTLNFNIDWSFMAKQENLRASLFYMANVFEERLKNTQDENSRRTLLKIIEIIRSPDQLISRILKYLSWVFFLLLPVFALLLKFVHLRKKINYIRHLVFSVHLHSFMFLLFIFILVVNMIFEGQWTIHLLWTLFLLPVYLIIAMRNFYAQNWGKSIFKSIIVSFVYNLIVFFSFGLVVYNALLDV